MPPCDCFLAHNSRDKPIVRRLYDALQQHGLSCWLDEQTLPPGQPAQPLMEQGIRESASIAICIGADGIGPWQQQELQAAIALATRDQRPVIPVLLPGAPEPTELPLFLSNRGWVDLRDGLLPPGLERLVWGITQTQADPEMERPPAAAAGGNDPILFLSYARQDLDAAQRLQADLDAAGHRCWLDTQDLKGGRDWLDAIEQAVSACYAFITLISPAAARSRYVKAEFLLADSLSKPLFPVVIDGDLPWYMLDTQAIPLDPDWPAGLQRLLRDLPTPLAAVKAPASQREAERAYLRALRLQDVLQQPDLYIHLQGDARQRVQRIGQTASHLLMRPEFALMRQRRRDLPDESTSEPETPAESFDDILTAFPHIRRTVLLGDPGAGKTTTLWKLARDAIERTEQEPDAPLPLLARLGLWTDPDQDLQAFLAEQAGPLAADLSAYLDQGRLLLLLDGLNEIPVEQRETKASAIRDLLTQHPNLAAVTSCRGPDYRDELVLPLDTLTIRPLTPTRIREFLQRYLEVLFPDGGAEQAERLFWELAGGDEVLDTWRAWERAGAGLDRFWSAADIPREDPNVWDKTSGEHDRIWKDKVASPYNLVRLGQNPYLLAMLLEVWLSGGQRVPANRGQLFEEAVGVLLAREALADPQTLQPTATGRALTAALGRLAWMLQTRSADEDDTKEDRPEQARTSLPLADAETLIGRDALDLGVSTSLLESGTAVRFTHQLLQEYFTALGMRERLDAGEIGTADFWMPSHWWQRSGWEEAAVLLAGLYHDDCSPVLDWLAEAQPAVAADCARRSGARVPRSTLSRLRGLWLPRLTAVSEEPPEARAAVGHALGIARLGGRMLDHRPGVGLNDDGLPDIAWVGIAAGEFLYQDDERLTLPAFHIARYPVTNAQFQAFVDDPVGHANRDWWSDFEGEYQGPMAGRWTESNCPRETVSWYQAVAFCRWLSARLGFEVRLPTEQEWERAARGTDGREYPWGNAYRSGHANINEGSSGPHYLERSSPVGLYSNGRSAEGVDDLAGNIWEWCLNKYYTPEAIEPDTSGDRRVLRGGSWLDSPDDARAAVRRNYTPVNRVFSIGFRVLCAAPI